jgi:hypothetical protein
MRAKLAGLAVTFTAVAVALAAGCGDSPSPATGKAGTSGAGTSGAGTSGAGTSGAGTSGAGTSGAGMGGAGAGGGGMAGGAAGTGSDGGAGVGADGGAGTGVTIPAALAVPTGAVLKFKVHATGAQVYTCTATTAAADGGTDGGATTYAWTLKAPDAKLYDENNAQVGTHFAGPTWLSTDGSDVVGARVASVDAPLADAIPWLLLKATSHMGSGVFMDVTYIHRLNTTKGKAPATGCDAASVNAETRVDYTADYWFYKGGAVTPDGGATPDWPFATVTIPAGIATPAGPTLKLKAHALGVQIYTCTASGGADAGADAGATTYAWTLKQPDAKLYDENNAEIGTHGAGPNWTGKDGSSVVGARVAGVDSPLPDAVQWLLLKAASHGATAGTFSDVTYIQRVNTTKGKAPATGCDSANVGKETSVAYTTDYYFYKGDAVVADGGAD